MAKLENKICQQNNKLSNMISVEEYKLSPGFKGKYVSTNPI